jgi:hypothetical protein
MVSFVYEIEIGGKKQIGSTKRLKSRMEEHLKALNEGKHCNSHMQNTYNRHQDFSFKVLSSHQTREGAYQEEQRLLDIYFGVSGYLMLNKKATAPPIYLGSSNSFSKKEVIEKLLRTKKEKDLFKRSDKTRKLIGSANRSRVHTEEEKVKRNQAVKKAKNSDNYKRAHLEACLKAHKVKSLRAKQNSTELFRTDNPSYKVQICDHCNQSIQGASAFKRFHGTNCKFKDK